jgi:hypothetical protein
MGATCTLFWELLSNPSSFYLVFLPSKTFPVRILREFYEFEMEGCRWLPPFCCDRESMRQQLTSKRALQDSPGRHFKCVRNTYHECIRTYSTSNSGSTYYVYVVLYSYRGTVTVLLYVDRGGLLLLLLYVAASLSGWMNTVLYIRMYCTLIF